MQVYFFFYDLALKVVDGWIEILLSCRVVCREGLLVLVYIYVTGSRVSVVEIQ